MYLPPLPEIFARIQNLKAKEILDELSKKPGLAAELLEELCRQSSWVDAHKKFLSDLVVLLIQHFDRGRISSALLTKIALTAHENPQLLLEFFPKDLTIEQEGGGAFTTSAILFSSISRVFLSMIASHLEDSTEKRAVIQLDETSYHTLCAMEELAFYGEAKHLWNYSEAQLADIVRDSHRWEIEKLEKEASSSLKRFFEKETVCSYINLSQENGWEHLKRECMLYVKSLSIGVEIFIPYKSCLGVLFLDYRQEAMEFFETLRSFVTHVGFTGNIIDDFRFSNILASLSHLKGVFLTMTTNYSERIFDMPGDIEDLTLDMCSWLTEERLLQITKAFPHIVRLNLARNANLSYRAMGCFSYLKALRELNLSKWRQMDNEELKMACQSAPELTSLILQECSSLTDQGFSQIGRYLKNLRSLDLSRTSITDTGLVAFLKEITSLRALDLEGCKEVSDTGIKEVIRKSSYLQHLNIRQTSVSKAFVEKLQKERPQVILSYL